MISIEATGIEDFQKALLRIKERDIKHEYKFKF